MFEQIQLVFAVCCVGVVALSPQVQERPQVSEEVASMQALSDRVRAAIGRGEFEVAYALTNELSAVILKREKLEDYHRAETEVSSDSLHQLVQMGRLANAAFEAGDFGRADKCARDLLALAELNKDDEYYGHALYFGHMVLGRLALHRGERKEAINHLFSSGRAGTSPVLRSFGPNMRLARDLLAAGERDAVLQFFEECRSMWKLHGKKLDEWIEIVKGCCRMPEFGANLNYGVEIPR